MAEKKGRKHHTKVKEYQVNCLHKGLRTMEEGKAEKLVTLGLWFSVLVYLRLSLNCI
jgi:hypothetical protein